jgi:NADPH-dependent 2,4-dienoyl-CoA reductase/sulfur reductase-like enzyme
MEKMIRECVFAETMLPGDAVETVDYVTGEVVVLPLAGPANRQGRISADNALMDFFEAEAADGGGAAITRPEWVGRPHPRFRGVQGTAVCGAFGVVTATTGASEKTLQRLGIDYEVVKLHPGTHGRHFVITSPAKCRDCRRDLYLCSECN